LSRGRAAYEMKRIWIEGGVYQSLQKRAEQKGMTIEDYVTLLLVSSCKEASSQTRKN